MPMGVKIDQERVEKCARIYASSRDAALALGIAPESFQRLCLKYGIDTPGKRKRKQR